jgi:hypothetical protein
MSDLHYAYNSYFCFTQFYKFIQNTGVSISLFVSICRPADGYTARFLTVSCSSSYYASAVVMIVTQSSQTPL